MSRNLWFENNELMINKYHVKDCVNKNAKLLLVLESPSKSEITHKAPAYGKTGKKIAKRLLEENESIGKLLKKGDYQKAEIIGIMNVLEYPMQIDDYCPYDLCKLDEHISSDLFLVSWLRKKISSDKESIACNFRKNKNLNQRKKSIIENISKSFKDRLTNYLGDGIIRVCLCGNVAQAFYKYNESSFNNYKFEVKYLNHPSAKVVNNDWNNENIKDIIRDIW